MWISKMFSNTKMNFDNDEYKCDNRTKLSLKSAKEQQQSQQHTIAKNIK